SDPPALPLDIRHVASGLEAPRHGRESTLRNPWLGGYSQHFPFSDPASTRLAVDRSSLCSDTCAVGPRAASHRSPPATLDFARCREIADFLRPLHADRLV